MRRATSAMPIIPGSCHSKQPTVESIPSIPQILQWNLMECNEYLFCSTVPVHQSHNLKPVPVLPLAQTATVSAIFARPENLRNQAKDVPPFHQDSLQKSRELLIFDNSWRSANQTIATNCTFAIFRLLAIAWWISQKGKTYPKWPCKTFVKRI
jgi:hypothetical protein